jgi:polyisoprenyl-phosphate glycosyltransferase
VTDSMREPMLSAVITCYKDEPALRPMHTRLTAVFASLGVKYEIIFVNDGSPDAADAVLKELTAQDNHVLAIQHSRNFGSQSAFVSGMQLATGDAIILLDGDLQDPPELISEFFSKWQEGYDVVYGCRGKREGSVIFELLTRVFYRIFRRVANVPMPLDAGDFSLMDRKVVDALLALPETDQFLRGLRAWVGFNQTGVDYVRPKRAFGRSTHSFLKNIWWARKGIFSFTFVPIELLGCAGATMTTLSVFALVHQGVDTLLHPETPHGLSLIIVLIIFFGSLQLLAIATLGEYAIKILEETKRRPRYIRKAIRHGGVRLTTPAEIDGFLQERLRNMALQQPPRARLFRDDGAGDGS